MKRIIVLLLALLFLSSCVASPNTSTPPELGSSTSDTNVSEENEDPLSLEKIRRDTDSYFRMFYENNQHYTWKRIVSSATDWSAGGSEITGFFDGDSLVKMVEDIYGENISSSSTTYYFINEKLIYVDEKIFWLPLSTFPHAEEYRKYFIIDGKLWSYSSEMNGFVESQDANVIDFFEQDKIDLLGNMPLSIINNTFSLPTENNLFNQVNKAKNAYLDEFFIEGIIYDKLNIYDGNSYNFKGLPHFLPKNDAATAFYKETDLRKLYVEHPDETAYTGYEYYPIDDLLIYVVVYYQEFENSETDYNDMKKNCYGEYFIVNGKVMVYDSQLMDLVESPDNSDILTYFSIAKESVESR